MYHANTNGVAILISDRVNFRTRNIVRNKEGDHIMMKGLIHQKDMTILNVYSPST